MIDDSECCHKALVGVLLQVQKLVKAPTVRKVDFDLLMEAIIEVAPHKVVILSLG